VVVISIKDLKNELDFFCRDGFINNFDHVGEFLKPQDSLVIQVKVFKNPFDIH